jgi:hypothetical protein
MPEIPRPTFTKNNRADGVFASCTHPNSPVSGSAFAKRLGETEIAIDRPEERKRTSRRIDAFASVPSASSAMTETCPVGQADQSGQLASSQTFTGRSRRRCPGPWSLTLLTVQTVFSRVARILINLLPARTRLNMRSMPGARRNVCARRRRSSEPQAQGLYPGLNLKVLCSLPQSIRLDQKLRRNFPRIVDSVDHFGRERALP